MKTYTEFLNEKGNVRPAARALAKADGLTAITDALDNAGLVVSTDSLGSLVVKIGVTDTGSDIYIRLDAVVTTSIR
jgi:hypothetical protein